MAKGIGLWIFAEAESIARIKLTKKIMIIWSMNDNSRNDSSWLRQCNGNGNGNVDEMKNAVPEWKSALLRWAIVVNMHAGLKYVGKSFVYFTILTINQMTPVMMAHLHAEALNMQIVSFSYLFLGYSDVFFSSAVHSLLLSFWFFGFVLFLSPPPSSLSIYLFHTHIRTHAHTLPN